MIHIVVVWRALNKQNDGPEICTGDKLLPTVLCCTTETKPTLRNLPTSNIVSRFILPVASPNFTAEEEGWCRSVRAARQGWLLEATILQQRRPHRRLSCCRRMQYDCILYVVSRDLRLFRLASFSDVTVDAVGETAAISFARPVTKKGEIKVQ